MKREYQTTEFWAMAVMAALWLVDRYTGTNLFDLVADGQVLTEAQARVAAIAAGLRESTGGDSDLLLHVAIIIYALRKGEKAVAIWKGAGQ